VPSLGGWQPPQRISGDNAIANEVEIAVDGSGNAIAAWAEQDSLGAVSHILARRYASGSGWGPTVPVETDNTARSGSFRLRMNASGNAVAAWRHNDGALNHIWANMFDPSRGWGVAGPIEADTAEDSSATPAAAIDPGGNAVVLWRQADGSGNSLFANRYAVGGGWGEPVPVESEAGDVAPELGLDVDPDGNAIAVWLQDDGTVPGCARFTVRASVFR
jgi:hypothetical protein